MNIVFGNKENFAIDISLSLDSQMGLFYIWINGKRLGDGEETYIKQKLNCFRRIQDLSMVPQLDIEVHNHNATLQHILAADELYDKTLIGLGMGFDSYLFRTYIYNEKVVMLWVHSIDRSISKLNLSKVTVECESVSTGVYENAVNEFAYWLDRPRLYLLEKEIIVKQKQICDKYGAPYIALPLDRIAGVAIKTFESRLLPVNGLRHPIESAHSSNWFIWAGEEFSEADNFFEPIHIYHLNEICPKVLDYLGLPPGWRFLFDGQYEDVWYDETLLTPKNC